MVIRPPRPAGSLRSRFAAPDAPLTGFTVVSDRKSGDVAAEPVRGFYPAVCVVRVLTFFFLARPVRWIPLQMEPIASCKGGEIFLFQCNLENQQVGEKGNDL